MEKEKEINNILPGGFILNDSYRIEKVIGEGGFGITYYATRLEDDTRVAVKEYYPGFDGEAMARFNREVEILKAYDYLEGIVPIVDAFEAANTHYIVMKYVEGITLSRYIRENGVFSYDELIKLMTPIIKSLSRIHRQGVIHRDISPENIQIGLDNKFYLLDFGAAKKTTDNKKHNTVIFKQGYAPPEQYTGDIKQGPWTDVYAMAATLYTALSGKNIEDAVSRMQSVQPNRCIDELSGVSDWQRDAMRKALSLKTSDRYQNMEELLIGLTVPPAVSELKTQRRVKEKERKLTEEKNRTLMACVFIAVMLFSVAAFWSLVSGSGKSDMDAYNITDKLEGTPETKINKLQSGDEPSAGGDSFEKNNDAGQATTNVAEDIEEAITDITGNEEEPNTEVNEDEKDTATSGTAGQEAEDVTEEAPREPSEEPSEELGEDQTEETTANEPTEETTANEPTEETTTEDDYFNIIEESDYEIINLK